MGRIPPAAQVFREPFVLIRLGPLGSRTLIGVSREAELKMKDAVSFNFS
jgi:hypothetical protein